MVTSSRGAASGFALALALVFTGCDGRDPTNPFDPANPDTGGRPDWLIAIAEDGAVELTWRPAPVRGFDFYELARSLDGGQTYQRIARIRDPSTIEYRDIFVTNGETYTYRLSVMTVDDMVTPLPPKVAGPGSVRPWIVENGGFGLLRTSPDGRHVRLRTGSLRPNLDAVPADSGRVWGADYGGDRVVRYSESGAAEVEIEVNVPYRLAYDRARGRLWVASWRVGEPTAELWAFDSDGGTAARVTVPGEIRDIEVESATGACLGAMGRAGGLFRFAPGGTLQRGATHGEYMMLEVDGPQAVAGDPFTQRLVRFDAGTLAAADSVALAQSPLTIHAAAGAWWTAMSGADIVAFDSTFAEVERVPSPGDATSLAFDEESRAIWVAQPTRGRVSRVLVGADRAAPGRVDIPLFDPFVVVLGSR